MQRQFNPGRPQLIELEELKTLIPHRGKMLLLSRVIDYSIEGSLRAEYDITEDCIFYDPTLKGAPASTGLEFIAQAISALSGIRDREKEIKPKIGFILSIPSMKIHFPFFKTGSFADIRVKECDCTDLIYTFEGEVFQENEKIIEGTMMVMEVNDEKQLNEIIKGSAA
jgi:predicted hotdog family 3-hydroxylacyl-ACP dehydratase